MATKKKAAEPEAPAAEEPEQSEWDRQNSGIQPPQGPTAEERMQAMIDDHIAMGVRAPDGSSITTGTQLPEHDQK